MKAFEKLFSKAKGRFGKWMEFYGIDLTSLPSLYWLSWCCLFSYSQDSQVFRIF